MYTLLEIKTTILKYPHMNNTFKMFHECSKIGSLLEKLVHRTKSRDYNEMGYSSTYVYCRKNYRKV